VFTRLAKYIDKIISYPSNLFSAAFMVAMVFVMLVVAADVFMRYVFKSPIIGIWDLCALAFSIIVWGPMAAAALKGSHVAIEFLKDRLPRLPRLGLELIIALVSSVILGIVSWRLVVHAMILGASQTQTAALRIPYEPFAYFAAFACAFMALAFLARVPEAVGKIRKEPEAVGKIQKEPEAVEKVEKMKGSSI
jgi:TRAP-type C4-dicarboxylate transport system permease small subunit